MHSAQIARLFGNEPITIVGESKTVLAIVKMVAEGEGVDWKDILSQRRDWRVMIPRHMAMTLAKSHLALGWSQIARRLNKDHSTVMNGVERITRLRQADKTVDNKMLQYDRAIQERWP